MVWILVVVGLIAILAILVLPLALKAVLNHKIRKMDGYEVRIDRLYINLFKGKINLEEIRATIVDSEQDKPLLLVPSITIRFNWKQLARKILDLNIVVDRPMMLFIVEKEMQSDEPSKNSDVPLSLKTHIEKLMAFRVSIAVHDGTLRYINSHARLDITTTKLTLIVHDFSNRLSIRNSCRIIGKGLLCDGNVQVSATLLPLASTLTVDLNLAMKSINLVLLNNLLRAFGKVTLDSGTLDLYAEVAVANNSFKGYIKPILKDLDFISPADRTNNFFRKIWERAVAGFYNFIKNKKNDQVGTTIPIEGRLDDPDIRIGVAVIGLLKNAFVKALTPSLDEVISLKRFGMKHRPG